MPSGLWLILTTKIERILIFELFQFFTTFWKLKQVKKHRGAYYRRKMLEILDYLLLKERLLASISILGIY